MRIVCAMMQKNEDLLLDAWCKYYSYMFGYENLYVFDNGSNLADVHGTLDKYERLGVNVIRSFNTRDDFFQKGEIIENLFNSIQENKHHDFFIPLDCDEFLAVLGGNSVACDKASLLAELERHIGTPHTLKVKTELRNSQRYKNHFYALPCNKTVFPGFPPLRVDHGYHLAATKTGEFADSRLCHIHMHNKPYARLIADAKVKLANLGVDVSDPRAIANVQHSYHLKRYFEVDEASMLADIDKLVHIAIPAIHQLLLDLGAPLAFAHSAASKRKPAHVVPAAFDEASYLARNPDVAAAGIGALLHYMAFGKLEGRAA